MITAIVLYDLPPGIGRDECMAHYHQIAADFLTIPGLYRKQFIFSEEGGVAGGAYTWQSREAAEEFYNGPWREGIIARYGAAPRITFYDTFAITDTVQGTAACIHPG